MALMESSQVQLGTVAPDFRLRGVDDNWYALGDFAARDILVVVFMCNHCPYVQACIDRLIDLQRDFEGRGVRLVGINSNDATDYPQDSFEAMKEFSREKKMNFPYLIDETQEVARAYRAVCTPDIFVYDAKRALRYHGRIDNNWKDASKVTSHDLRDALSTMVRGNVPSDDQEHSMGCSIKWRN